MNYEKLTVDRFALNLKEGKYETLTGARRAIGKTSSWDAKEKEKAHVLANKHFGSAETPKAATKTPKKAAVKAAAAPKKQARKVAKKVAVKAAKPAPAPAPEAAEVETNEVAAKPAPARRAPVTASATASTVSAVTATTLPDAVNMGRQVLSFLAEARAEYSAQKEINPGGDFNRLLSDMKDATTKAISLVAVNVPASEKIDPLPPARASLPHPEPKPTPAPKAETKKAAPAPAAVATPVAAPALAPVTTLAPVVASPSPVQALIEPAPAPPNGTSGLSAEELAIADKIRGATPASTIAALPRPVNPEG